MIKSNHWTAIKTIYYLFSQARCELYLLPSDQLWQNSNHEQITAHILTHVDHLCIIWANAAIGPGPA